jgi:hypothetical protein
MTVSSRLDAVAERLAKVRLPVSARLAIEEAAVSAERMSDAEGDKMGKHAEKFRTEKVWLKVTTQPKKKGKSWVGRATFEYKGGKGKEGKDTDKHSVPITLKGPAKLKIEKKKVKVTPKDKTKEPYFLGEMEVDTPTEESKKEREEEKKNREAVEQKEAEMPTEEEAPVNPKPAEKKAKGSKDKLAPPMSDEDEDGIDDQARVGVPADQVPPPPDKMPRLPNLTDEEREIESRFADAFEKAPALMTAAYTDSVKKIAERKGGPPKFVTDDVKNLSEDYTPMLDNSEGADLFLTITAMKDEGLDHDEIVESLTDEEKLLYLKTRREIGKQRARNNTLLHQTANAIAKRAFVEQLDELSKLDDDDPKKSVLVTSGGCGAGKGFALENAPDSEKGKVQGVGAIWDAAGEQNATENPWIMEECRKRGIKAKFLFVDSDPDKTWDGDWGVMKRAANPPPKGEGRMVDARVFADSYANGAKNFKAFHDKNKDSGDAEFIMINSRGGKPTVTDRVSDEALSLDADALYAKAMKSVSEGAPSDAIKEGATKGKRIWGPKEAPAEQPSASVAPVTAYQWLTSAGFVLAEDEEGEEAETATEGLSDETAAMAEELAGNLAYNIDNQEAYYERKWMDDLDILAQQAAANKPPEEEEDMDEGMQGLSGRIDAVTERLSAARLPSKVLLAVEEAADAVSVSAAEEMDYNEAMDYYDDHGRCPDGWHNDEKRDECVPAETKDLSLEGKREKQVADRLLKHLPGKVKVDGDNVTLEIDPSEKDVVSIANKLRESGQGPLRKVGRGKGYSFHTNMRGEASIKKNKDGGFVIDFSSARKKK